MFVIALALSYDAINYVKMAAQLNISFNLHGNLTRICFQQIKMIITRS